MRILLLVDKFYPIPHANGICVSKIINSFKNVEEVHVICRAKIKKVSETIKMENGWTVHVINEDLNYVGHNVKFLSSVLSALDSVFLFRARRGSFYLNMRKEAEIVLEKHKCNVVISVINPIESGTVGEYLKSNHKGLKLLIYDLDTISNKSLNIFEKAFFLLHRYYAFKIEKEMFKLADVIVHLKQHEAHFKANKYSKFAYKTLFQDIPLLYIQEQGKNPNHNNIENCTYIYAGKFYKRIREYKQLLRIFKQMPEIFSFRIYTDEPFFSAIKKDYSADSRFQLSKLVDEETLRDAMEKASFLVGYGNKKSCMFPSKIITYIGFCKPIIHVYQNDKDPVLHFLRAYPDVLFLDARSSIEVNVAKLKSFISKKHEEIDWHNVFDMYRSCDPGACSFEIEKLLVGELEEQNETL